MQSHSEKVIGTPSTFTISCPWMSEGLLRKDAATLFDVGTETIKLGGKL